MKIGLVMPSGASTECWAALADGFLRAGHAVCGVGPEPMRRLATGAAAWHSQPEACGVWRRFGRARAWREAARRLIAQDQVEVLLIGESAQTAGLFAAARAVPHVAVIGDPARPGPARGVAASRRSSILRRADAAVTWSAAERAALGGGEQLRAMPVWAVGLASAESASDEPVDPSVLVGVCPCRRCVPRLRRALHLAVSYVPSARLGLIGLTHDGSPCLLDIAIRKALDLPMWITLAVLPGATPSQRRAAASMHGICLMPSAAAGRDVLLAMAAGRAVVAPMESGVAELIDHGRNGWLIDSRDPRSWGEALVVLLTHHALRRQMGRYARAHAPCAAEQADRALREAIEWLQALPARRQRARHAASLSTSAHAPAPAVR